jgi:hypothetical protein
MSEISQTQVSLRLFGDELDPDEVTKLLGRAPDVARRRGEGWWRPDGRFVRHPALRGSWSIEAERSTPGDLDGQINNLLSETTDDLSIWSFLTSKYHVDMFCGLFLEELNEGISISPRTLQMLGERGIVLNLDIYAPS